MKEAKIIHCIVYMISDNEKRKRLYIVLFTWSLTMKEAKIIHCIVYMVSDNERGKAYTLYCLHGL